MESSDSIGVYGEAKAEYTRQLCIFLVPALENYFLDILKETKETEKDPRRVLWVFQDLLKQFPDWNVDKVQRETEKIINSTKCDYLEEILTAVFIAHTKVLSAIRLTSRQKKLQITIPKLEHFLHRTMSECARLLWSNAYLFAENGTSIDRQKNLRQVEQLLHEGVLQSIRGMLPVKSILKEYLADDMDEINEGSQNQEKETLKESEEVQTEDIPPVVHATEDAESSEIVAPPSTPLVQETPESTEAPVKEQESEKVPEIEVPSPVIDLSGSTTETQTPAMPTIIVDTEPPVVSFTDMDAVFDSEDPEKSMIRMSPQSDDDDDDEYDRYASGIQIDDSEPPSALEEYENLEGGGNGLAFGEDEFESL